MSAPDKTHKQMTALVLVLDFGRIALSTAVPGNEKCVFERSNSVLEKCEHCYLTKWLSFCGILLYIAEDSRVGAPTGIIACEPKGGHAACLEAIASQIMPGDRRSIVTPNDDGISVRARDDPW